MLDRSSLWAPTFVFLSLAAGCTSILGDFNSTGGSPPADRDATTDAPAAEGGGDGLGNKCSPTATCASGQTCADGVCCSTPCDGVCEKCDLPGSMGTCTPVPANTDPDLECVMMPLPDAGVDASSTDAAVEAANGDDAADGAGLQLDAGLLDSGDASADLSDARTPEAGLATPEAGLVPDNAQCVGSCNGQRACQYPGQKTNCGGQFCGSGTEQGGLVCDGTGRCNLGSTDCGNYACESNSACGANCTGQCVTTCQSGADCSPSAFYNAQSVCQSKKGTGVECGNANECSLGNCDDGYCCNTDCKALGGRCDVSGSAGQCNCGASCGDGGACQAYYADKDNDGHGDPNSVKAFCAGTTNVGYVTNNDDCDDTDKNTHPGQDAFFTQPRANGTFQYNCVDALVQQYPVYPGGSCGVCTGSGFSCGISGSCSASGTQSYLGCGSRFSCGGGKGGLCFVYCGGDSVTINGNAYYEGFTAATACGAQGPFTICETCPSSTGAPSSYSYSPPNSVTMPCH